MFAAAVHRDVPEVPVDAGTIRGDLLALAHRIRADMSAPAARAVVPHIVAELARSPELAQRFRETFVATERAEVEAIVERAVRRGDPPRRADTGLVHRVLGGALFFSIFVIGESIDDNGLAGPSTYSSPALEDSGRLRRVPMCGSGFRTNEIDWSVVRASAPYASPATSRAIRSGVVRCGAL